MKKFSLTLSILLTTLQVFSVEKGALAPATNEPGLGLSPSELLLLALLLFAIVSLFATFSLLNALKIAVKERMNPTPFVKYQAPAPLEYEEWLKIKKSRPNIWTKILSLKPLEEESSMIIPHSYDGIHELNNPVPRWFNVLFFSTVIFAGCYLYYYHIGDGPKQDQEYATEMEKADADKNAFLAVAAEKFDENSIKLDGSLIANGKTVFMANCIACHGEHGQGIVGPNLTDEFWLHGGSINDVFKTVKYGVPAKGMASWEKNLSSKNIAEVVNFILSLQGSKPANPKVPQGDKYEAKDSVQNETLANN